MSEWIRPKLFTLGYVIKPVLVGLLKFFFPKIPFPTQWAQVVHVSALLGGTVKLPCDTTPPTPHNPLLLTVWFKDQLQDPIYR